MIIIAYILTLFIGLIGAIIATLPPSATNLAVVKYTSDKGLTKGLHLAYGAALGEVFIAGLALAFGVLAKRLFEKHEWIQITFIVLMIAAGIYFLSKKTKKNDSESSSRPKRFINGLLLGGLNIPMFIYWTAIFSISSRYVILDKNSPWLLVIFFLVGVFAGKFGLLYLYGRASEYMTSNFAKFKGKLNKIIGFVLIVAGVIQAIKLVIAE